MNNNEEMKKLLKILLLIPMVSFGELKSYKGEVLPLNYGEKGYTLEELGLTQEDQNLLNAISMTPNIEFYRYKLNFSLEKLDVN